MTERPINVLAIAGSGRRDSLNQRLMACAVELAPSGATVGLFTKFAKIPVFNEDLETDPPAAISELRRTLSEADGVLISTPEYNQSIPGGVKNLLDWLSRSAPSEGIVGVPVAVTGVSSGPWGTRIAQSQLKGMLLAAGAMVLPAPHLFVADGGSLFDDDGKVADRETRERLSRLMGALVEWVRLFPTARRL
jgi:chromate reductase